MQETVNPGLSHSSWRNDTVPGGIPNEALAEKLKALRLDHSVEPDYTSAKLAQSRHSKRRGFLKPLLFGISALGLFAAGFLLSSEGDESGLAVERATIPVPGTAVAQGSGLVASGYVVARRQATVAAQVLGQVRAIHVEEGQRVIAGELLASLDASAAQAQAENSGALTSVSQAELQSVRARLTEAEVTLARTSQLSARGFARQADLTERKAEVLALQGDLAAGKSRIAAQRANNRAASSMLARYQIRAPFNGIVTQINAQPGEVISPGSAGGFTRTGICTIVDMNSLEVEVDVAESSIAKVVEGQPVRITLAAYPDIPYQGSVIAVVPIADRSRASFQVRIRFASRDAKVLPEMAANVLFKEGK